MRERLWGDPTINAWLDEQLPALEAGRTTPFAVADALLARSATRLNTMTGSAERRSDDDTSTSIRARQSRATSGPSWRGCAPKSRRGGHDTTQATRATLRSRTPAATSMPLYTALDAADSIAAAFGCPGRIPFTRGIHPTGYRGRLWTMRQFAGFGSARDTNARYKYLLEHGQTGLSVAFDFPRSWATTPTTRARKARWASAASRSRASPTWRRCSTASRSTRSRCP